MNNEQHYPITTLPEWNQITGPGLLDLYERALAVSLKHLCRECLWALLALSIFFGAGSLLLW